MLVGEDTYVASVALEKTGRPDMVKLGQNGINAIVKVDYIYYPWDTANGRGRLKQIKAGPPGALDSLQNLTYSYDAAGNVTRIQLTQPTPTEDVTFQYDALNRLTSASGPYTETYEYDQIGNLTAKQPTGTEVDYTYPAAGSSRPHAVTAVTVDGITTTGSYEYDANGNMVTRTLASGTFYLRYDPENRLVAVDKEETGDLARIADFTYDGDGNRVRGVVTGTSTVTTTYIGAYYEWVSPGTALSYYYLGGKRVAMRDANLYFLLGDHLGSMAVTADANGNRTGELRYAAWGETRYEYQTTPTKRRYTGQIEEADLGLYFYNARWYDSSLGRFAQADSFVPEPGNPQGLNRYSYVLNRPLGFVDPTGHEGGPPAGLNPWELDWWWKNRWYNAHGYGWNGHGWGKHINPTFADRGIIDEVLGEAGILLGKITRRGGENWQPWTDERAEQVARAVALWGRKLSGGVQALAGLFNHEAVRILAAVQSPYECGFGTCACAPPPPYSDGNTVYVPVSELNRSDLYKVIVHELAHIVDWHSSIGGQSYSGAWGNRAALTDYGQTSLTPTWDCFAEAATVYVLGRGYAATDRLNRIGAAGFSSQMSDMRRLLEHWGWD